MNKQELQNIFDYSKSKQDLCKKLGIRLNQNGYSLNKELLNILSEIEITEDQITGKYIRNHYLEIQKRDYDLNPKYCEYCGKKLPFEKQNSKCCNQSCGSSLGNIKKNGHSKETKQKISKSLSNRNSNINLVKKYYNNEIDINYIKQNNPNLIKICHYCGNEYIVKLRPNKNRLSNSNYCSDKCCFNAKSLFSKELRQKEIELGTFQGWKSRNITSYAEKFWKQVLDNNNIQYIREKLIEYGNLRNGERYFLDFYIEVNNRKIDLEIDGKQHQYKDRKDTDSKRDIFLTSLGIEVYRISWNEINSENGKRQMQEKINKFLEFIG